MTTDDRDPVVERLLQGFEPPPPPVDLRSRVLGSAREAALGKPRADSWSRIWEHPGLRIGWAAAIALLLLGHVLVTPRGGVVLLASNPELDAEQRVDPEVMELLRPMRISEDVQPILGLFAAAGVPAELEMEGNHS